MKIIQLAFKEKSYLQILDEQDQVTDRIDLDEQTPDVTLARSFPLLKDWEIKQKVQKTDCSNEMKFITPPSQRT